jgi:Na+/H+ antiporter NhaD/arsenite permease-like protein
LAALVSGGGVPALSRAARNTRLLWGVGAVSFLVSAALDNLTTTIVVLSVLQRAVPDGERELRRLLGAAAVIAANAGGAWTPIGDVTTTMLWIGGQLTPLPTMRDLLVPSLACIAVPLALLQALAPEFRESGSGGEQAAAAGGLEQEQQQQQDVVASTSSHEVVALSPTTSSSDSNSTTTTSSEALAFENASQRGPLVLAVGLGALLSVPVFKHFTGLPPYMGIMSGLSILWLLCDTLHFGESRSNPRVSDALRKLDFEGVFFFLGILLAVGALEAAGVLTQLATALAATVPSPSAVAGALGLVSALVDNVPLVAATMGMYDLATTPADSQLWQLIALCAGTGGSLLVIGSAAGVAFMSIEGAGFGWYLRRVTPSAAAGYGAGLLAYALMHGLPFEAAAMS